MPKSTVVGRCRTMLRIGSMNMLLHGVENLHPAVQNPLSHVSDDGPQHGERFLWSPDVFQTGEETVFLYSFKLPSSSRRNAAATSGYCWTRID